MSVLKWGVLDESCHCRPPHKKNGSNAPLSTFLSCVLNAKNCHTRVADSQCTNERVPRELVFPLQCQKNLKNNNLCIIYL